MGISTVVNCNSLLEPHFPGFDCPQCFLMDAFQWVCPTCTLVNGAPIMQCAVCGLSKPPRLSNGGVSEGKGPDDEDAGRGYPAAVVVQPATPQSVRLPPICPQVMMEAHYKYNCLLKWWDCSGRVPLLVV